MNFVILSFYCTRDPMQGLGDGHGELRDANLLMDALGRDAGRDSDGSMRMREEREGDRRATSRVTRRQRTEVPTGSASSDEGEKEWGATRPSLSPLAQSPPSHEERVLC
jgi:hypothetical protein